jgi:hypothetical protein
MTKQKDISQIGIPKKLSQEEKEVLQVMIKSRGREYVE